LREDHRRGTAVGASGDRRSRCIGIRHGSLLGGGTD
jgi:hypothetical protein